MGGVEKLFLKKKIAGKKFFEKKFFIRKNFYLEKKLLCKISQTDSDQKWVFLDKSMFIITKRYVHNSTIIAHKVVNEVT